MTNQITTVVMSDQSEPQSDSDWVMEGDEGTGGGVVTAALGNTWSHCVGTRLLLQFKEDGRRMVSTEEDGKDRWKGRRMGQSDGRGGGWEGQVEGRRAGRSGGRGGGWEGQMEGEEDGKVRWKGRRVGRSDGRGGGWEGQIEGEEDGKDRWKGRRMGRTDGRGGG